MTFHIFPDNDTTASKQEHWDMSQGSKIQRKRREIRMLGHMRDTGTRK